MVKFISHVLLLGLIAASQSSLANQPIVGKKAAQKYFSSQGKKSQASAQGEYEDVTTIQAPRRVGSIETLNAGDHYLSLSFGKLTQSDSYNWGDSAKETDIGGMLADLTYRLTMDAELYDEGIRVSYGEFFPNGERAQKLSFLYTMLLPDAGSQFPIYFGLAMGPGIFMKQLSAESALSLDYQLLLGLRLFNVFEKTGFSIEGGLRNHLHVMSNGQLNGVFVTAGAVFTF